MSWDADVVRRVSAARLWTLSSLFESLAVYGSQTANAYSMFRRMKLRVLVALLEMVLIRWCHRKSLDTVICYTKVWVRLHDGQLFSNERLGYSWSVTFTWDAQNVTLLSVLCIEDNLPGERPVVESGNILLEWCTITGRPDLPVEDAVVSKQTNLRRNIVRDVINI